VYLALCIRCNDATIKSSDNGKEEYIECEAKTMKPECSGCSIANPNSHPNQTRHLNTLLN
jgi:hypothetical protein